MDDPGELGGRGSTEQERHLTDGPAVEIEDQPEAVVVGRRPVGQHLLDLVAVQRRCQQVLGDVLAAVDLVEGGGVGRLAATQQQPFGPDRQRRERHREVGPPGLVDQSFAQRGLVVAEQRLEATDRLVEGALRHVVAGVGGQSLERGLGLGDEPVAPALPRGAHDGRLSHVRRRTAHGSRWR